MIHYLRFIRLRSTLAIMGIQAVVYYGLRKYPDGQIFDLSFLKLLAATFFVISAGYMINDYFDIKTDSINKPHRLLIPRKINRRKALLGNIFCNFIAFFIGLSISIYMGLYFAGVAALLFFYSAVLKRLFLVGNLAIAILMSVSIGILYQLNAELDSWWLSIYITFAFLGGWMQEILKDLKNLKGESRYNYQNIPNNFGIYKTKKFLGLLLVLIVIIFTVQSFHLAIDHKYLSGFIVIILVFSPSSLFVYKLFNADKESDFNALYQQFKVLVICILAIIPFTNFVKTFLS